jgi:hypothetical protein
VGAASSLLPLPLADPPPPPPLAERTRRCGGCRGAGNLTAKLRARGKYHGGRIGDEQGREDLRDDMVLFHCAKILGAILGPVGPYFLFSP